MKTFWTWETSEEPRLQAGFTINLKHWGFGLDFLVNIPTVTLSFGPFSVWAVQWES